MLNQHFKAKKITSGTTQEGEMLYFDIKSTVLEKLENHCENIGLKLEQI